METILIVDDSRLNRKMLRDIFEKDYQVLEAADGEEGIAVIEENRQELSLIFLDLVMPKKSGLDVLKFLRSSGLKPGIAVVMITGGATVENDLQAYEYGADDIIYKPFEPRVVIRRVQNLIELYAQRHDIEAKLRERTRELRRSKEKLAKNNEFLVQALGSVVEFRSMEAGDHIQRVSSLTKILLQYVKNNYPKYGLTDEQITMIASAAALHDVGKIGIADSVLNKPGRLTAEEYDTMKGHTIIGCELLDRFKQEENEYHRYCYEICRWHHEKADGKGYPDGLTADRTPIWAQATAVADCFDALVSKRVYKDAFGVEKACEMILHGECGKFDDDIMNCFKLAKGELTQAVAAGAAGKQ